VETAGSVSADGVDEVVDGSGSYLAPGYMDVHFHGSGNYLVDRGPEDVTALCGLLPQYGVTGYLPTITPGQEGAEVPFLASLAALSPAGAQILGFFLEGPFVALKGAIPLDKMRSAPGADHVRALREAGAPFPVVFGAAPDAEAVLDLIPHMAAGNVPVFTTHTAATVEVMQSGIDAGISHATHFYDVFPCPAVSDPGVRPCGAVEAILADPRVTVDFILDGEHVHPVAVQMALECKGPGGVCLITDANIGAGLPPGRHRGIWGTDIDFAYPGAPARMVTDGEENGCLAGSGLTMDRAVRNAVKLVGVSIPQAVRMASANPARVLRLEGSKGTVIPGYDADLVLLDRDLEVRTTWVGGVRRYDRNEG